MKIQFLGTGGAFDYEYGNAAAIVDWQDKRLLLDCGSSVYEKLRKSGLIDTIDYVLITHLHTDHIGSLGTLIAHWTHISRLAHKANIIYPDGQFGDHLYQFLTYVIKDPSRYANFFPISDFPGLNALDTTGRHVKGMPTRAYLFEEGDELIVYSGDLGDPEFLFNALKAYEDRQVRVFHEIAFFKSKGSHTYYKHLEKWLDTYEIYAYHTDPLRAPEDNKVPLVANYPDLLV